MITMYILSTPVDFLGKAGVWKQMDYQIIRTASQLDLQQHLRTIPGGL